MKNLLRLFSIAAILAAPMLSAVPAYAASATLSLSASGCFSKGCTVTISVRENSGDEPVNAVQANFSYPASLLSFSSINTTSAFPVTPPSSGGGGSVSIARGAYSGLTGSQTVATVSFKALANAGAGTLSFTDGSQVVSANSNAGILGGTSGTSVTLREPAPAPDVPPPDTIPPKITAVSAGSITTTTAVISWTTSEPASSEVDYGPSQNYGLAAVDGNFVTDHKVTLNSAILAPGILYHYMVKSSDPAGNHAAGADATFTTKGAVLAITVVNQKDKPVKGAKVEISKQSGTTNQKGQVTLSGIPTGKFVGTVTYKGKQSVVSTTITTADPAGKAQAVKFKIQVTTNYWPIILVPLILILVLGSFFFGWEERGGSGGTGTGTGLKKFGSDLKQKLKKLAPGKPSGNPIVLKTPPQSPAQESKVQPNPTVVTPNISPKS